MRVLGGARWGLITDRAGTAVRTTVVIKMTRTIRTQWVDSRAPTDFFGPYFGQDGGCSIKLGNAGLSST
jgi:hypothetical protein